MHLPGVFQLLVIALIALVLFGRGRISDFMGDVGKGVKSFRKSIAEDDEAVSPAPIAGPAVEAVAAEPPPPHDQVEK